MAINKVLPQFQASHGIDLAHTVVERIVLDFKTQLVRLILGHYQEAQDFNNGKEPVFISKYVYGVDVLPASVLTDAVSLKNTIEAELINLVEEFEEGTQVNDDGTAI